MRLTSGHGGHGVARAGEFVTIGVLGCSVALLAVLTVSRPGHAGRGWHRRKGAAQASENSESAEEWLGPLRGLGVRPATQRGLPAEPEPAQAQQEQAEVAWPSYPDQQAYPEPGDWGGQQERTWLGGSDDGERADWGDSGNEWDVGDAWGPAEPTAGPEMPAWPDAYPQLPAPGGWVPESADDPQAGYLNGPLPQYLPAPPPVSELDAGYAHVMGPSPPEADGSWAGGPYLVSPPAEADQPWAGSPLATGPQAALPAADGSWADSPAVTGPQAALPAAADERWAATQAAGPQAPEPGVIGDEDDTSPLPVIIGTDPPPDHHQDEPASFAGPMPTWEPPLPRGVASIWLPPIDQEPVPDWEPPPGLEPVQQWEPAQQWESAGAVGLDHGAATGSGTTAAGAYPPGSAISPAGLAQEKMEQIKELYLTAEAIGEDALTKHFELLSQRQRDLIREFFEEGGLGSSGSKELGGDSAPDGAPLPG
jgi:hypothetical protein